MAELGELEGRVDRLIRINPVTGDPEVADGIRVLEPAIKADIFRQAADEIGLKVSVKPSKKIYYVGEGKPDEPAVELISNERDLTPFWKRVKELEVEATKKAS